MNEFTPHLVGMIISGGLMFYAGRALTRVSAPGALGDYLGIALYFVGIMVALTNTALLVFVNFVH